MLKAGDLIDLYDDVDGRVIRDGELLRKHGELNVDPAADLTRLPDKEFALVVMTKTGRKIRKYPMHTPDSLAVSTHYFEKVGTALPEEAQKIAASNLYRGHLRHGARPTARLKAGKDDSVVTPYFDEVASSRGQVPHESVLRRKEASIPSTRFAIDKKMLDGSRLEAFPMDTVGLARESAKTLRKVAFQIPARDRVVASCRLLSRLKEFGETDEHLEKVAAFTRNPAFPAYMEARRHAITNERDLHTLDELIKKADAFPGPFLAAAVEKFDLETGIYKYWDHQIRNPWDSCFSIKETSVKCGDKTITKKALLGLAENGKLASIFNESSIKSFKAAPLEVFESLPAPTKQLVSNMID